MLELLRGHGRELLVVVRLRRQEQQVAVLERELALGPGGPRLEALVGLQHDERPDGVGRRERLAREHRAVVGARREAAALRRRERLARLELLRGLVREDRRLLARDEDGVAVVVLAARRRALRVGLARLRGDARLVHEAPDDLDGVRALLPVALDLLAAGLGPGPVALGGRDERVDDALLVALALDERERDRPARGRDRLDQERERLLRRLEDEPLVDGDELVALPHHVRDLGLLEDLVDLDVLAARAVAREADLEAQLLAAERVRDDAADLLERLQAPPEELLHDAQHALAVQLPGGFRVLHLCEDGIQGIVALVEGDGRPLL